MTIPERILFDTGCVGTTGCAAGTEHCPDFAVSNRICMDYDAPTYGFCITVRESQLPLGIIIDCNCDATSSTYWRICNVSPDGDISSWEGGNECLCVGNGFGNLLFHDIHLPVDG